jgi:methyl-accepting chemotaxis protein
MNIRAKLFAAFATLILLLSGAGAISGWAVRNLSSDVRAETYLSEVERAVWELRFGLPNYVGGEVDGRQRIRADSQKWLSQVSSRLESYRRLSNSRGEAALIDDFSRNFADYTAARPTYFELVDAGRLEEAKKFRATQTNPPAIRMIAKLSELVQAQEAKAGAQGRTFERLVLFAILANIILAAAFGAFLSNNLAAPLRRLAENARRIAAGDLRGAISPGKGGRQDEIGELSDSFATMAAQLRTALGGLHEVTRALNQAVAELSSSSIDQNENLSRQDAALRQAQVTAEEIRQTSKVAAEKASLVLKMTERADEVGRSGEAAVEQSAGGMTEIRAVAGGIADKITELGERTRQLGVITDGVKDLADQSNMLALNAAIEAVRSGEHGKGFGVVAREIRSLADQSIQSTNRAREILQDVTNSVRLAVSITKSGAVKMEGGLQQIRASGDYMRELSGIIKENSGIVRQIAAAVGQQHAGVSQIFTAVTDLSDMMAQTMKRLESTNVAVETVKAVSSRISGILKDYQV